MDENIRVRLTSELKSLLESVPSRKMAPTIRKALSHWLKDSHILYAITYTDKDVIYYGHTLRSDFFGFPDYLLELKKRDTVISHDFDIFPLCNFRLEIVGEFNSLETLIEYRTFLMNKRLDDGLLLYNDEIIRELAPRYIRIAIDYDIAREFGLYCKKHGKTINAVLKSVINKLLK